MKLTDCMKLTDFKHVSYQLKPNKNKIPVNNFTFEQLDEFNEIYQYAKDNFTKVAHTQSQGISYKVSERMHERYFVVKGNQRFELVIICAEGCYRFLLQNKKAKDNEISGQQACRSIYKYADKYNIDFNKYACDNGLEEKQQIEKPHIKVMKKIMLNKKLKNVYHMDFKSSYASRICEAYPELKPMYEEIYNLRKENNGYYKHVLTNSIGAWQSQYCVDYTTRRTVSPYKFAKLSRIAINGTRAKVEEMLAKLEKADMIPLLTNTDGIWYYSDHGAYHDENEGNKLGNWENDHNDCEFLMTGPGSYQFVENGVCESVVRGLCNLDAAEPDRTKWKFGDILNLEQVFTYKFNEDKGVYKTYE